LLEISCGDIIVNHRVRGGAAGVLTLFPIWIKKHHSNMNAICWLSKTGTRKRMLTGLPLSQTLRHKKSTQAPFTNRMGNGSQTRKRHLTSSAKAELTSAKVTSMTGRKPLWRVGHSFSKQSELVMSKMGRKPQKRKSE